MASPSGAMAALQAASNQLAGTLTNLASSFLAAANPLVATVNALNTSMAGLAGSLGQASAPVNHAAPATAPAK